MSKEEIKNKVAMCHFYVGLNQLVDAIKKTAKTIIKTFRKIGKIIYRWATAYYDTDKCKILVHVDNVLVSQDVLDDIDTFILDVRDEVRQNDQMLKEREEFINAIH